MAKIIVPNLNQNEPIEIGTLNRFLDQFNQIGTNTADFNGAINGENLRVEAVDRRNILKNVVQEVPISSVAPDGHRSGPGLIVVGDQPGRLPMVNGSQNTIRPGQGPTIPTSQQDVRLGEIEVIEGDLLLVTVSFSFEVFPEVNTSNNLKNQSNPNEGSYEVEFSLAGFKGTKRIFNTAVSYNGQGGGYRYVPTSNSCTITGLKTVSGSSNKAVKDEVHLLAEVRRSNSGSGKDATLSIKSFTFFSKCVRS